METFAFLRLIIFVILRNIYCVNSTSLTKKLTYYLEIDLSSPLRAGVPLRFSRYGDFFIELYQGSAY